MTGFALFSIIFIIVDKTFVNLSEFSSFMGVQVFFNETEKFSFPFREWKLSEYCGVNKIHQLCFGEYVVVDLEEKFGQKWLWK
jgi:hypothetical protein